MNINTSVIAYKFQAPNGSYWYIDADDLRTLDYWRDKRKLIPLKGDEARIAAGVVIETPTTAVRGFKATEDNP